MTDEPGFVYSTDNIVRKTKAVESIPVPVERWEAIRRKLSGRISDPWFYQAAATTLLGSGISVLAMPHFSVLSDAQTLNAYFLGFGLIGIAIALCIAAHAQQKNKGLLIDNVLEIMDEIDASLVHHSPQAVPPSDSEKAKKKGERVWTIVAPGQPQSEEDVAQSPARGKAAPSSGSSSPTLAPLIMPPPPPSSSRPTPPAPTGAPAPAQGGEIVKQRSGEKVVGKSTYLFNIRTAESKREGDSEAAFLPHTPPPANAEEFSRTLRSLPVHIRAKFARQSENFRMKAMAENWTADRIRKSLDV